MTAIRRLASNLWSKVIRYPQRAQAVVVALIALGTAFGLGWNGIQVGAVAAFSAAVLAFVTEQNVTPTSDPVLDAGTKVTTKDGQAAVVTLS